MSYSNKIGDRAQTEQSKTMGQNIYLWTKQPTPLSRPSNGKARYYIGGKNIMNPINSDVVILPQENVVEYYGGAKHTPMRVLKNAKVVRYEDDPHPAPWGDGTAKWTAYYEGSMVSEWFQSFINFMGNPHKTKAYAPGCGTYERKFKDNLKVSVNRVINYNWDESNSK